MKLYTLTHKRPAGGAGREPRGRLQLDTAASTEQALLQLCRKDHYDGILIDPQLSASPLVDAEQDLLHSCATC